MKDIFCNKLIKFLYLLLLSLNVFSSGNENDSLLLESLDEVLIEEYKPCSDQSDINSLEVNTISSLMIVSEGSFFNKGEVITSSSGVQAIVDSYDVETQKLTYHQDASTGFETFLLNETITGSSSEIATVKEFIVDLTIPCSELIVSIEEAPQQMIFIPKELAEEARVAASTAAYQSKLAYDAMVEELMEALAIEQEIAAFEAKLAADLASEALDRELAEFETQLKEELANQAALAEFLAKLDAERAAAAASTAAYQAKVAEEKAAAAELAAFKAELAAHEECKAALNLSDSNIALFKTALVTGNLFKVGPQITAGTEFTANRWDDYASCIGALNYKNHF